MTYMQLRSRLRASGVVRCSRIGVVKVNDGFVAPARAHGTINLSMKAAVC